MKIPTSTGLAALAAMFSATDAFFRMPCSGPLSLQRADPIVNPGQVSPHVHTIVGGNGFGFTMSNQSTQAATCSSCKAKKDKSNYWIPNLYVKTKQGKFNAVENNGATIYYLQRTNGPNEKLVPFPAGFRMVAGDPMRRSFDPNSVTDKAVSWVCLGGTTGETRMIPNAKCPSGLRAQIVMPSCWDGKNLDSADHKSHVAYPDGTDHGKCPLTHPVPFVTLFYEFIFNIGAWDSEWVGDKHPFALSNGDPLGYGLHADFVNGWDIDILRRAINECNSPSGIIEECKILELYQNSQMDDCIVRPSINEPVEVNLDQLPGCNPLTYGPQRAIPATNCPSIAKIGPQQPLGSDMSSKGWNYVDCVNDDVGSRTFNYRDARTNMTVDMCIDICAQKTYNYAGLQYSEECWCGNSIPTNRLGAMKCTMPCAGNQKQFCGGPAKLSTYIKATPAKPKPRVRV